MGCCQTNCETGEIFSTSLHDIEKHERTFFHSNEEFAEISLDSRSEETEMNPRYTEQAKNLDCIVTMRSTSYSLHRSELEQSFLQTRLSTISKLNK